jgi:hypothetical protein
MTAIWSRRNFLKKSIKGSLGLFVFSGLANTVLSSCKKNQPQNGPLENANKEAFSCPDSDKVSADDRVRRANLKYVDKSPIPSRTCDNCKLYTLPKDSSPCGGCKVLPGPIHPKGYCQSWYYLM